MRSLFATILALSASTSAWPAIANPVNERSPFANNNQVARQFELADSSQTFAERSLNFSERSLNIAKQIPPDAIGLVMVDLDLDSWQVLKQLQVPVLSPLLGLDILLNFLVGSPQISIAKDVQPWLGKEVAIAFLSNPNKKDELGFAALAMFTDDKQFDAFVEKVNGLDTLKPTETLYKNIKISEWEIKGKSVDANPETPPKLDDPKTKNHESEEGNLSKIGFNFKKFAIAKLPSGVAVIATDSQSIQQMIDIAVSKPKRKLPSLANNQLLLRSLNNPLWNRSLIAGYGDYKGIGQFTEMLAEGLPETSELPGFSRAEYIQSLKRTLSQYNSFDLFTWITPKGLRSQSNSYFSEVRSPLPKDTEPRDRLLSFLPSTIYGAITSRNFSRQWQWFVEESKLDPTYKIFVEGLRIVSPMILGTDSGIDIEKDIISWMDGEYAFVAFPSDLAPLKDIGVNLTMGMLIRTSKPDAANVALDKVAKYIAKLGRDVIQVKKRQVGATLLTSFEFPDGKGEGKTQSVLAYGWRDRQTLMVTFGSDTAAAFIPTPKPSLGESDMFRDAIADMPQPNFGYFYLDANAIAKRVSELVLLGLNPSADDLDKSASTPELKIIQSALNKLGGLVFVYSETSDRLQSDAFLGLKP